MSKKVEIMVDESRAMIYIPDNSVEADLSFKVFVDGEIKSVCKKMNMKELQEAITDAENNYIGEDDTFVITEEGKRWLELLQK